MGNRWETLNRERKALRLLDTAAKMFDGRGLDSEDMASMNEVQWEMLAQLAGTTTPSETTRQLCVKTLRVREADIRRAPDPFAGLSR